jgi:hypothetical protein
MLQAAAAKAAKSTVTSRKRTVSTNVADYAKKDLQVAFANALVSCSVHSWSDRSLLTLYLVSFDTVFGLF